VWAMTEPGNLVRLRQKLLWRIHRRYVTKTEQVRIGSLRFDFTRIENPDTVLDQVAAGDRREDTLSTLAARLAALDPVPFDLAVKDARGPRQRRGAASILMEGAS